jgi:LPXTG-motif cell wall-anchored protein
MRTRSLRPLYATVAVGAASLLFATPANAYTCSIVLTGLTNSTVTGGQTIGFSVSGLTPNAPITITSSCLTAPVSGTASATSAAQLTGTIIAAPPATCSFSVAGVDNCSASEIPAQVAGVAIEAPGGSSTQPAVTPTVAGVAIGSGTGNLPRTGQDSVPVVWLGLGLIATGGLLLFGARAFRRDVPLTES